MPPTAEATGDDVAIVWIHGADCDPQAYTDLASKIQSQGSAAGQKVWVGLPEFLFDVPEPLLINGYVQDTLDELRDAGFTGDNIFIAGHSLGGVMAQDYANSQSDLIKGQFLMGSVLLRDQNSTNDDGTTHWDYNVPTLTMGGTKDGLMRVTRLTEAYWTQVKNVESAQAGMFPVFAMEGTSHMSYMTGDAPSAVKSRDLKPDVDGDTARTTFAGEMVKFISNVLANDFSNYDETSSGAVLSGLIDAFEMEGSYDEKEPCYGHETENPFVSTCLHGNPWTTQYSQAIMGGTFDNSNISVTDDDNYHRVQSVAPVHLPFVSTTCTSDVTETCTLDTVTISENKYEFIDEMDTGYYPVSAWEIKTKLSSRQRIQIAGGNTDADFHETDEVGNRCADINDVSIQWALERVSQAALDNYNTYGIQMVTGDDLGPYNEGPLWIWTYMKYNVNDDKTVMTVQSPMMRTPVDYFISSAAGFHYCKVLSPFAVMEHIYVDSLFERNGI